MDSGPFMEDDESVLPVCQACPVAKQCLQTAVNTDSEGIWGGTTTEQRRQKLLGGEITVVWEILT
jgi:hypothetical protein